MVNKDICCEKIQKGCGSVDVAAHEYTGGSCSDDECSTCSLSWYTATNYFNDENVLMNRIIDYDGGEMTEDSVQAMCCAAGIQLDDPYLIRACIADGGATSLEYELTDHNECIEREVTTKMYQDADMNAIPGYADFTEVTSVTILSADACCMKACSHEDNNFLLPACPDRQITDTSSDYGISNGECESTQTDTITYFLSDKSAACNFVTEFRLSTYLDDAGITKEHCCKAAVVSEHFTEDMYSNWCFVSEEP